MTKETKAQDLLKLGQLVHKRRKAVRWSRATLAAKLGVSEATVKNLENGRHAPLHTTLYRLLQLPELALSSEDLLAHSGAGGAMNSFLDLDPLAAVADLRARLKGAGGDLDQSAMYLDAAGADAWLRLSTASAYAAQRELAGLAPAAQRVREQLAGTAVDVIGLGCGTAEKEIRLCQLLCEVETPPPLRLFLLDISQPLLAHAFRAAQALPRGCGAFAVAANFYHLPLYINVLDRGPGPRRRLVCLFGGTLGNLSNELLFLRHQLVGMEPGDFLLLHTARAWAPREAPEEIKRLDPALNGSLPEELQALERQLLIGPIERYGRPPGEPLEDMEVQSRLEVGCCPVPGSYAIEQSVLVAGPPRRRFVITYKKRYEPAGLVGALADLGWESVAVWDDGPGKDLLCLFQRL